MPITFHAVTRFYEPPRDDVADERFHLFLDEVYTPLIRI